MIIFLLTLVDMLFQWTHGLPQVIYNQSFIEMEPCEEKGSPKNHE